MLSKQKGGVTILLVLLMLIVLTGMTVMTGTEVKEQTRLSADDFRDRMAYEVAMSGLHAAMERIDLDQTDFSTMTGTIGVATYEAKFCECDANCKDGSSLCDTPATTTENLLIYSKGVSDDGLAIRHVSALVTGAYAQEGIEAVLGGDSVTLQGNAFASSQPGIKCGTSFSGNGKLDNPPSSCEAFDPEAYFEAYTGMTLADFKNRTNNIASLDGVVTDKPYYYINGTVSSWNNGVKSKSGDGNTSQWGTPDNPAFIVISGNLTKMNGNATVYGIVYVEGEVEMGNGGGTIHGLLATPNSINVSGTFDVYGDSNTNTGTTVTTIGGTVKDWL